MPCRVQLRKRMVIGYLSGMLMYINQYCDKYLDRMCVEGETYLNMEEVHTYAVHISDKIMANGRRSHHAWLGAPVFNSPHFINASWYFEGDRTPQILLHSKRRVAKVEFVQKVFSESSSDSQRVDIIHVSTLRSTGEQRGVLIDYGIFVRLPQCRSGWSNFGLE